MKNHIILPRLLCVSADYAVCLSVRLLHACILSKRLNISPIFFHHRITTPL